MSEIPTDAADHESSESRHRRPARPETMDGDASAGSGAPLLGWPPPGLERVQGDLWLVARKMVVSGSVLALPLVLVITLPQSPHGLGPLGDAWWVTLVTTLVGLILLLDAGVSLFRLLRRAHRGVRGYAPHVVGLVVSDRLRDAGFLLQGARLYSELSPQERRIVGHLRSLVPACYLIAGFWLSVGFGTLTVLAARGAVSPSGIALGTLAPPAALFLLGLLFSALEGSLMRKAKRGWFKRPWAQNLAVSDAEGWRAAALVAGVPENRAGRGAHWVLRAAMASVVVAAILAAVPPATLVPASSVGAILSSWPGSSFAHTQGRIAAAEVYRGYQLEADPTITPQEAGEILNTLMYVGRTAEPVESMLPPARAYEREWHPDPPEEGWRTSDPPFWTDTVWVESASGGSASLRAFLADVAAHPARAEFSRLARAAAVDVVGGRYRLPFDYEMSFWSVPIPKYSGVRMAAYTHLGAAALRAAEGRFDEAERLAREVISVGLLMVDDSPHLIGLLVGATLVRHGGAGLEKVLRASGREARADLLDQTLQTTESVARMFAPRDGGRADPEVFLESLPSIVADSTAARASRWEYLGILSGLTPCLNLRRVVFGPGEQHAELLASVRADLVRFPADQALFDVTVRGFGTGADTGPLSAIVAVSMGGADEEGSCARVLSSLPAIL